MSRVSDELRAKAKALYELARQMAETSDSLVHVLHAAEYEQQADAVDESDVPAAHMIDRAVPLNARDIAA
jgi:hypothetical protein